MVEYYKITSVIYEHAVILACSDQLCAIMRKLAVPDFVGVLIEAVRDSQREVISVTHVIRVE